MYWLARQNRICAINMQRDVNTVYRKYSVFTTSNMVLKQRCMTFQKMTYHYFQTRFKITMSG